MKLTSAMEQYVLDTKSDVQELIRKIAPIPAPSHHEDLRVEFVKNWMEKEGAKGVYVDEAKNVIWPVNVKEKNDIYVFMAHTDVVFPDTTELPFREDDKYMYCPGVGDDTARLAVLLYAYRYFHRAGMKPAGDFGVLIVANSCEEGLGNLDGTRNIIRNFGSRIKGFYTVDGGLKNIVTIAVGSHRYKVTVRTEGGHSYGAFGNRNAIAYLASMINTLYQMKVPAKEGTKTTYNVGTIEGGTSVNTIAQEASMLYEYRSDDRECLAKMKEMFEKVVEAYRAMGIEVEVTLLGERPCGAEFGREYEEFLEHTMECGRDILGVTFGRRSGSTDANIPLSKGINAVCVGGCDSVGAHTREEFLDKESLIPGIRFVMALMSKYFA